MTATPPAKRIPVAVLISGNGSNLQALMDAAAAPDYPAQIALVISNRADAYGLVRAQQAGIPTVVIDHKAFKDREAFDRAMDAALNQAGVQLVCLAGFMRLLTPWFIGRWEGRLINIHPSLLPAYKGLNAIAQAWEAGEKKTGVTVHQVVAEMDAGPVLAQAEVEILPGESLEALTGRVHAAEHRLYPQVVRQLLRQ